MTYPWNAGDILTAADLNAEFGSKLPIAGGKILQIVRATDATQRSTTSTSFVDVTGMSVTITPQKSDSAILLVSVFNALASSSSTATQEIAIFTITDASNNGISGAETVETGGQNLSGSNRVVLDSVAIIGYATPATTSATTYKLRFRASTANNNVFIQNQIRTGQMYAIEVSA
jgi:hypothetical protein